MFTGVGGGRNTPPAWREILDQDDLPRAESGQRSGNTESKRSASASLGNPETWPSPSSTIIQPPSRRRATSIVKNRLRTAATRAKSPNLPDDRREPVLT